MSQRTAIVYDWIDSWGGVERVLHALHAMYPNAHWYSSYVDTTNAAWAKKLHFRTTFLQRLPRPIVRKRALSLPLYALAFETLEFTNYDLVISVTSAFAKGIITKPPTKHLSYLLTPPRYLWGQAGDYMSPAQRLLSLPATSVLRQWDWRAARRPDKMISISDHVAARAKKYYSIKTPVIHPPFDTQHWNTIKPEPLREPNRDPYYLVVSRLEPYKRIDLAIEACQQLGKKLIVVGSGSLQKTLKRKASNNTTFLTNLTDAQLAYLYQGARALLLPQEEDFGLVALEAQWWGCPVISYVRSGATETFSEQTPHTTFSAQSVASLSNTIERSEKVTYNREQSTLVRTQKRIRDTFGAERFSKSLQIHIDELFSH